MKNKSEWQECIDFVKYLKDIRKPLWFTHLKQERQEKTMLQKVNAKRIGINKGTPDYVIRLPFDVTENLIWIEMKKIGGRASKEQFSVNEYLNNTPGNDAYICYGAADAVNTIEKYYE